MAIREARPLLVTCACLMVMGCTYTGAAMGPGVVTIQTPGVIPPVVVAGPSDLAGHVPGPQKPMPRQGAYSGTARVLDDPGGACASLTEDNRSLSPSDVVSFDGPGGTLHVHNFVVRGTAVTMGPFRGSLRPDGSVMLQAGDYYVLGRFVGADFIGRFWQPQPGCTYSMVLRPIAG